MWRLCLVAVLMSACLSGDAQIRLRFLGDLVANHTAASCSRADVNTMLGLIDAGEIGLIPAGSCAWTSGIEWTAPANAIIIGAGSLSTVGGGDLTTITDNIDRTLFDYPMLAITISTTGTFRLAGLTVAGTQSASRYSNVGLVRIIGTGGAQFRADHLHIDEGTYTGLSTAGQIYGVIDHSIFDMVNGTGLRFYANNWGGGDFGDGSWSDDTTLGSNRFVFVEDNVFNAPDNGGVQDCYQAPRFVIRYNTINVAATQTHPTGGSNRARGCRAWEIYGNTFTADNGDPQFNAFFMSSGTGVFWGNSAPTGYTHMITAHSVRKTVGSYPQSVVPDGWGYCSGTYVTGTVNVAANGVDVTKASGSDFNTSWLANTMIHIGGTSTAFDYLTASINSTTSLTLSGAGTGGALTGAAYYVGSVWDQNATSGSGYLCLDQPGAGKSDAMDGEFPDAQRTASGTEAWPNQAKEPVYEWLNTWTTAGGGNRIDNANRGIDTNRDIYSDVVSASCTAGGACTTGMGSGTSLPTSCTTGTAFWRTDEGGNWHLTNGTAHDGKMYVCTATNTWTARYGGSSSNSAGVPYTYPHPLNTP